MSQRLPYGSWPSPITAEVLVSSAVGLGGPAFSAGDLWWSELRPAEAGRVQIVRRPRGGVSLAALTSGVDVLADGFSARTRVHEYGGGAWWLHDDTLIFANWSDQRLYRIDRAGTDQASVPVALTPEPATAGALRYADGRVDIDGRWTICVRESHGVAGTAEARNEIVAIPLDGSAADDPVRIVVLVGGEAGPDFVSNPRLSPDEAQLSWLQWDHPDMPWEGAALAMGRLGTDELGVPVLHDGQVQRWSRDWGSFAQPEWSPEGHLYGVHEVDGWWRICWEAFDPGPITPAGAEWAQPQWVFGQSWYAFAADGSGLLACARRDGRDELHWLECLRPEVSGVARWGPPQRLDTPFTAFDGIIALDGREFACIAASHTSEPAVITLRLTDESAQNRRDHRIDDVDAAGRAESAQIRWGATAEVQVERSPRDLGLDSATFSVPEHLTFTTNSGAAGDARAAHAPVAHAQFYRPSSAAFEGPADQRPPLLIFIHGGPTSAARPLLNLALQFWTSRGFAVADVDYRGSTGYGRDFRHGLDEQWGIADVEDCLAAARFLAERGDVDGGRLAIRGGSAGGFTVLCALTFHDLFTAGTSLYGIADLEALATDTHKFESRYLDRLVGPYPDQRDRYVERSPIHHIERLATPLLILQGLDDEVVPPAQAELLVAALADKGVPHAYLAFEGEQHGFRQAATIKRAIEAELYFYGRMFGFVPADHLEPVPIS